MEKKNYMKPELSEIFLENNLMQNVVSGEQDSSGTPEGEGDGKALSRTFSFDLDDLDE
jgi:hypothetical protein